MLRDEGAPAMETDEHEDTEYTMVVDGMVFDRKLGEWEPLVMILDDPPAFELCSWQRKFEGEDRFEKLGLDETKELAYVREEHLRPGLTLEAGRNSYILVREVRPREAAAARPPGPRPARPARARAEAPR